MTHVCQINDWIMEELAMKIRRGIALILALMLAMGVLSGASAQTEVKDSYTIKDAYVTMNKDNGMLLVQSKQDGCYTLMTSAGRPVTSEKYIYMKVNYGLFEVATSSGLNVIGLIDETGREVMPMRYGDIVYVSDRWQMGVVLENATSDHYDYKSGDGSSFYLVGAYDVYFDGVKVGSLGRTDYKRAYAYGAYLYVSDEEGNEKYYNSQMVASDYAGSYITNEYDETRDGVYHCGSGQRAFVAGCTLTADEVELDIMQVDGRFVDLQGNVLFAADAKYDYISDFEGDYAKTSMNGKHGLIDRTGREVLACEYDEIGMLDGYMEGGYQICVKDGKVGYVSADGEVTCEFKYASSAVQSTYKMPATSLSDLDGSVIVLTGAAGELEQRYSTVSLSGTNGCPLFAAEIEEGKAGVVDMYGNAVIPMDGTYDSCYDFTISEDGTVVLVRDASYVYHVFLIGFGETGASDAQPEADVTSEGETPEQPAQDELATQEDGWVCSCGHVNTGKFCSECGTAKPTELKCPNCGYVPEEGTTPKFCSECGTAY